MIFYFPERIIDGDNSEWLVFEKPERTFLLYENGTSLREAINEFFLLLSQYRGYYFCGFFSFELGYELLNVKREKKPSLFPLPLIYGGFFKEPVRKKINIKNIEKSSFIKDIVILEKYQSYRKKVLTIKEWIRQGRVYQINYTFPLKVVISGDPATLFFHLWSYQKSPAASFLQDEKFSILSLSPEVFFEIHGGRIVLKPMKGTASRSHSPVENTKIIAKLTGSEKEKAENAMIVDLIRNDLGRISRTGSVRVEKVFEPEEYETVIQLVSVISSRLHTGWREKKFWEALFPSGSVTGAPKISVLQHLDALEDWRREIYTGSIGYITPEDRGRFNVAIRTLYGSGDTFFYHTGSGITIDSFPRSEYKECITKCRILRLTKKKLKPEYIFTTMKFSGGILYFKQSHIKRLEETKNVFSFPVSSKRIKEKFRRLEYLLKTLHRPVRIHFRIYSGGKIRVFLSPLEKKKEIRFALAEKPAGNKNIFVYYKTAIRSFYEKELDAAKKKHCDEVLFYTEEGFLTEGSYTNIIVKMDGKFYTPPAGRGLLNGIMRQKLIKRYGIIEKDISIAELEKVESFYFVNSVRGIMKGVRI